MTGNYVLVAGQVDSTVDAGFFVCPGNFVFTPRVICGTAFVNLNSLEPIGYTGGTWTDAGIPVDFPDQVYEGTYVYTKIVGPGCTATGTLVITREAPDYQPVITILPNTISGPSNVNIIVDVVELEGITSCKPVTITIPKFGERFSFIWNPTATNFGVLPVQNSKWYYMGIVGNFHAWRYIGNGTFANPDPFPAYGVKSIGFNGIYNNQGTDGYTTFTTAVVQGSGGEINYSNNSSGQTLFFNRN